MQQAIPGRSPPPCAVAADASATTRLPTRGRGGNGRGRDAAPGRPRGGPARHRPHHGGHQRRPGSAGAPTTRYGTCRAMVRTAKRANAIPIIATVPPSFTSRRCTHEIIAYVNDYIRGFAGVEAPFWPEIFHGTNNRALYGNDTSPEPAGLQRHGRHLVPGDPAGDSEQHDRGATPAALASQGGPDAVLERVTLAEIQAIFGVTDALGISRRGAGHPARPRAPRPRAPPPSGKLEIVDRRRHPARGVAPDPAGSDRGGEGVIG